MRRRRSAPEGGEQVRPLLGDAPSDVPSDALPALPEHRPTREGGRTTNRWGGRCRCDACLPREP